MKRTKGVPQSRLLKLSLLTLLMGLIAISPAVAFGRSPPSWLPEPVRNWSFDVLLVLSPPIKKLSSIAYGSIADDRVLRDTYGERVSIDNQGLTVVGTLYQPEETGKHPGVILIHGSTPEGRQLGLYRLLGKEMAGRGYVVLSIDLRGYGESDDPPRVDLPSSLHFTSDILRAIDSLSTLGSVDPERTYIIGHSLGASPAIEAGIQDDRISKIVAIGPPRRVEERYWDEGSPEFSYFYRRTMRYMKLSQSIPLDIFQSHIQETSLSNFKDYFSEPGHKPLLLLDGMWESPADRLYLQQFYNGLTEPKKYITLENADHYANIANFGSLVFYDRNTTYMFVNEIDRWLSEK